MQEENLFDGHSDLCYIQLWRHEVKDILVGNGSFETLIKGNFLYVDKTAYLYQLIRKPGAYYFLSRPRRFGKSLTIRTLEEIFKGNRELFRGLYIDGTDYDWRAYPVIHIDFGNISYINTEKLRNQIRNIVLESAVSYGVEIPEGYEYNESLRYLIGKLAERGEDVVVLVDEYDRLISDNIYRADIEEIRGVLRDFYSVLKAQDKNIRFCFITGVTKFSKMSIFSTMNNLFDLSFDRDYATMFGYTQKEVEEYFAPYIEKGMCATKTDRESYLGKLKAMYDGYRFAPGSETVYNPVSIGSFFARGGEDWESYWIETGGTKLLMDMARKVHFNIAVDLEKSVRKESMSSFDIVEMTTGRITPLKYKSLLLQSGYLTIKNTEKSDALYLGFPNEEVETAVSMKLIGVYGSEEAEESFDSDDLLTQFRNGNAQGVIDNLFSVYAAIPYRDEQKQIEADYQGMFYAMMVVIHAVVNLEVMTNKGRIDAVVRTPHHVWVIEFKRDESADAALRQINDKGYWEQYRAWSSGSSRTVHLLGINFSTEKRNIDGWKEEILI